MAALKSNQGAEIDEFYSNIKIISDKLYDLRSWMTNIFGFWELLQLPLDDEKIFEYRRHLFTSIVGLAELFLELDKPINLSSGIDDEYCTQHEIKVRNILRNFLVCVPISYQILVIKNEILETDLADTSRNNRIYESLYGLSLININAIQKIVEDISALEVENVVQSKELERSQNVDILENVIHLFGELKEPNKVARPTAPESISLSKPNLTIPFSTAADSIGPALKKARTNAGMTQAAVAKIMKTGDSAIRRLESGRHQPNVETLESYAAAIGCEIQMELMPIKK